MLCLVTVRFLIVRVITLIRMLKPIPGAEKLRVKSEFEKRYKKLLGKRYSAFMKYSLSFLRRSIRVNTVKISVDDLRKRLQKHWKLKQIPWCKQGFWIEHKRGERRDVGNTIEHSLGYFYVQEAASMIPPIVLKPRPGESVLDMCAAPGSKATQMAAMMRNKGVLVANDVSGIRLRPLAMNLQRSGVTNTIVTLMSGQAFRNRKIEFDKILVDAPCSGTGTIRRSLKTFEIWNPNMVKRLAGIQRRLIETGLSILKPRGTLVYSTCTMEPEENEGIIDFIVNKYEDSIKIEKISIKGVKSSPPILKFDNFDYDKKIKNCLRIWPQDNDTEGFFIAKIRKLKPTQTDLR